MLVSANLAGATSIMDDADTRSPSLGAAGSAEAGGTLQAAASPTVTGRVNTNAHTMAVRVNSPARARIPGR